MREIVTLQFGPQANYIGTHFWNTQESYFTYGGEEESPVDHDVHFRAGIGADGSDTFMPRTVIYDLSAAFGAMRRVNALYETRQEADSAMGVGPAGTGSRSTQTIRTAPTVQPSDYQIALDAGQTPLPTLRTSDVRFWSDYSRVFFHPRSMAPISEFTLRDELNPFDRWESGQVLFETINREADLIDRDFRPFLEESDHIQGVQVLAGTDDAWGGFSSSYLELLRDEIGKTAMWVYGCEENRLGIAREKQRQYNVNNARSTYEFVTNASVYVPLQYAPSRLPSYIQIDAASRWHASALQAMAIETLTLPTRLRTSIQGSTTLDAMEQAFNMGGTRKVAKLELSIRKPPQANGFHLDEDRNGDPDDEIDQKLDMTFLDENPAAQALDHRMTVREHVFGRADTIRGDWDADKDSMNTDDVEQRNRFSNGRVYERYLSTLRFPLLDSYPHIVQHIQPANSLAVRSSLATSTKVSQRIRTLGAIARRSIGVEEREALSNGLEEIAEEYLEGWSDDEMSDDE